MAEQTVSSNLAGAINATTPLWTVLIALATRTEPRLTGRRWLGILLGFAGTMLILAPWRGGTASVLACLAALASYGAGYVFMGRYLTGRGTSPLVLSASQLVGAAGLLLLAAPFGGFDAPQLRVDAVIALLVLGALGTGVAYVLNYRNIGDDGPILASTVTYLLPVVAVILGVAILDETITVQLALGVAIVLVGVP